MSVSKAILDETFSLGGNFGGDEIGAKTEYFGGDVQVALAVTRGARPALTRGPLGAPIHQGHFAIQRARPAPRPN